MRRLTALGIALAGVFVMVKSFGLATLPVSLVFGGLPGGQRALAIGLSMIPVLAALGLALYMIIARDRLAAWYVPESDEAPTVAACSLLRAGLVLVGVYLVVQALPSLVSLATTPIVNFVQVRASLLVGDVGFADVSPREFLIQNIPAALSTLTSLGLGLFLLAKREFVVGRFFPVGSERQDAAGQAAATAHCPSCGAAYDPREYDGKFGEPRCDVCKQPLDVART